jgi:hypothetical protein
VLIVAAGMDRHRIRTEPRLGFVVTVIRHRCLVVRYRREAP